MNKKFTSYTGRAGEHRVLSELLLRGYNPALRAVDNGVDIVPEDGITLQVKTVSHQTRSDGAYVVALGNTSYRKGNKIKTKGNLAADFLVVWLVDINQFYIIPSGFIGKRVSITLNYNKSQFDQFKNNWQTLGRG